MVKFNSFPIFRENNPTPRNFPLPPLVLARGLPLYLDIAPTNPAQATRGTLLARPVTERGALSGPRILSSVLREPLSVLGRVRPFATPTARGGTQVALQRARPHHRTYVNLKRV